MRKKRIAYTLIGSFIGCIILSKPLTQTNSPIESSSQSKTFLNQVNNLLKETPPSSSMGKNIPPSNMSQKGPTKRAITLTSNITKDMLKYRWGWSDYEPTSFYLEVKNTSIRNGETKTVELSTNHPLEITYHFEFKNGLFKGSKTIELEIPEHVSTVGLSFSWKEDHRIISTAGRTIGSKNGILKSPYSLS